MKHFRSIMLLFFLYCIGITSLAQERDSLSMGTKADSMVQDTLQVGRERNHPVKEAANHQEPEINIRMIENRLRIEELPQEAILEIYNIMGVKVYNRRIPPGTGEYPVHLTRGYYILKIGKTTKKIAIR
ncbi:MAG: T9SS type A sorting domain-containing protein [Proteiniphilum sp.]|nr:T9SS type A sorting domain-containing protein [Proteiniphilum sp.]